MSAERHSWQIVKAGLGEMTLYVVPGPTSNADRLEALDEILVLAKQIEFLKVQHADFQAWIERLKAEKEAALPIAFADCEALVAAMARQLGEDLESGKVVVPGGHPNGGLIASWAVNSLALAINMGQHRTAETNERAIVAAHREAAGFNSSKAGGEARSRALSPERRREIAANAGRAKKGFGKLSPAQRRFLARAHGENGAFYLADADAATPQRVSGWWRTARSLAKRGIVEFVPGANVGPAPAACKLTDAARARWAAKKGE